MKKEIKQRLTLGEHFAEINNVRIHYYVAGCGPVMMIPSPGWGPSVNYIMPIPIFEKYFKVIYFDTRLSGKSTGPKDPQEYSLNKLVSDIEALRIYLGQEKIFLAGHSGGGHQVLEYAIQHNEKVAGLITIDAIAATDEMRSAELSSRIAKKKNENFYIQNPEYYERASAFMLGKPLEDPPTTLAGIIDTMGAFYFFKPEMAEGIFKQMDLNDKVFEYTSANGFQGKNLLPQLSGITSPTLIIVGADDFICDPISQAARIHNRIKGSKLEIISESGHLPWVEQPAVFSSACEDWIKGVLGI